MIESKRVLTKTAPLCFLPNGKLICYQHGDIVILENQQELKRFPLLNNAKERIFGRINLVSRLLRLGVRAVEVIDNSSVVLSIGNKLYELNIDTGELSKGYFCGEGIRPLAFSTVKSIEGVDDGIYFGGYLGNEDKIPVHIYRRIAIDEWEIVYTFPNGAINHIHSILPDPFRNCLWIFTGDFGTAAAIWKVTQNFKNIELVVGGDQQWRCCVAFVVPEGLLYATDTPKADNYLYLFNPQTLERKTIIPLPGSCINCCRWRDKFVISTTVESETSNKRHLRDWLTRKRGYGIKDDYVHMYCGDIKKGFEEIVKEKKDRLPFTLFQFGVFRLPSGSNNGNILYYQPIATIKNDLCLMSLKIKYE